MSKEPMTKGFSLRNIFKGQFLDFSWFVRLQTNVFVYNKLEGAILEMKPCGWKKPRTQKGFHERMTELQGLNESFWPLWDHVSKVLLDFVGIVFQTS